LKEDVKPLFNYQGIVCGCALALTLLMKCR